MGCHACTCIAVSVIVGQYLSFTYAGQEISLRTRLASLATANLYFSSGPNEPSKMKVYIELLVQDAKKLGPEGDST